MMMNSLFSKLKYRSESIDSAVFEPVDVNDESLYSDLNSLTNTAELSFSLVATDEFGDEISFPVLTILELPKLSRVMFVKKKINGVAFFFSPTGFLSCALIAEISQFGEVYIFEQDVSFSSLLCDFKSWNFPEPLHASTKKLVEEVDARKIVRDTTGEVIHARHGFWIAPVIPDVKNKLYEEWLRLATFKASALLASEIWRKDGQLFLTLKGGRSLEIGYVNPGTSHSSVDLHRVHMALDWIYSQSRDAEVRHTLICQRISTQRHRSRESWLEFLLRSVACAHQSAREDYRSHIHVKTVDLLKAVTDIRKTVSEEVNKIVDRTQSLTTGLLRDLSISFTLVALRQVLMAKNFLSAGETKFLLLANIFWLIVSVCLSGYQNKLYFRSQIKFRYNWSKRVIGLISADEFSALSRKPFKDSIKAYKNIKNLVNFIYACLVMILLFMVFFK
ncbi:hypothetical protein PMI35_02296 [Pseudomonas sp. GM78]|nr:hypothetical protein PMI35_02296 [Pseudomonas sp. GM78]